MVLAKDKKQPKYWYRGYVSKIWYSHIMQYSTIFLNEQQVYLLHEKKEQNSVYSVLPFV